MATTLDHSDALVSVASLIGACKCVDGYASQRRAVHPF